MLIAGSLLATGLVVPIAMTAAPAGALSHSPFCLAVFSWSKHPVPTPTNFTVGAYHAWVKAEIPYYQRMQATAPNAQTKHVLTFVVSVLQSYGKATSLSALTSYEKLHYKQYGADVKVLAASIIGCATSGIITLP